MCPNGVQMSQSGPTCPLSGQKSLPWPFLKNPRNFRGILPRKIRERSRLVHHQAPKETRIIIWYRCCCRVQWGFAMQKWVHAFAFRRSRNGGRLRDRGVRCSATLVVRRVFHLVSKPPLSVLLTISILICLPLKIKDQYIKIVGFFYKCKTKVYISYFRSDLGPVPLMSQI